MAEAWHPAEEARLTTCFGTVGREELQGLLPAHSYRGIKAKAIRLGLLTLPTEADLRARVGQGASLREMGREFDVDSKTIHAHCRRYGIALPS